jgi:phosphoribosyl 1,2-cyclic phosphodiesterase
MDVFPHQIVISDIRAIEQWRLALKISTIVADHRNLKDRGYLCSMSLFVASLNSGSNGNCYYIGNEREAVLVDAGLSCRETEKRMRRTGLSMDKVKAIFISHEHGDHIRGVDVLARKFQLPVYVTSKTQHYIPRLDKHLAVPFIPHQPILIGDMAVTPFPKLHDAIDPHSFIISYNNVTVGVFTDIGVNCDNVTRYFKLCTACFLESNYDEAMLETGRYPYHLKNRIRGGQGHLSNKQAVEFFHAHRPSFMSHLFLSHLSKDNNDPDLARNMFLQQKHKVQVVVASRYEESGVYHITSDPARSIAPKQKVKAAVQTSLF